jgi:4-hydroxythreonine-4-phosphate dehydrogenase
MGDPAGIGPEIIVKALQQVAARSDCNHLYPIVYGDPELLAAAAQALNVTVEVVEDIDPAAWPRIAVADAGRARKPLAPGAMDAEGGRLAYAAIERAVEDAMAGVTAAVVTAPISKEALNLAGYAYSGHTELFAALTGSPDSCMMLAHGALRVSHVSTHVALARAPQLVTAPRLNRVIDLTLDALARFGIGAPRIGVAALNPHAGEGGLFGAEDAEIIAPVVQAYRERGVNVAGPISGDTVFVRAVAGEFDAVIAMFHDQGHIPVKLLGFQVDPVARKWVSLSGVNVTLGLPFVRTSVDHGTAFDIAGKGIASPQSMVEAIDYALAMTATAKSKGA